MSVERSLRLASGDAVRGSSILMDLKPPSEDAMVHTATVGLERRFPTVSKPRIEDVVRRWIRKIRARARVQTFVGILAERRARAELQREIQRGRSETRSQKLR